MMQAVRQDATENKQAIVNAARQLLISEGPGVSMRAIAKKAGVGVATVSRHFPERLALIDAISGAEVRRIEEEVDKQLENFPADPEGTWRGTIHRIANLNFAAVAQAASAEVSTAAISGSEVARITQQRTAELDRIYRRLIEPAQRAELCPRSLSPLELHLSIGLITRPLPAAPLDPERMGRIRETLIDTFLDGLKVQAQTQAQSLGESKRPQRPHHTRLAPPRRTISEGLDYTRSAAAERG